MTVVSTVSSHMLIPFIYLLSYLDSIWEFDIYISILGGDYVW